MASIFDQIGSQAAAGARGRRRNPLPMIGVRAAGEARLNKDLRRRFRRRANRQAARKFNPQIAALKAQRSAINNMLNREVRAIEQTVGAVRNDLSTSLGGLKDSGLKGQFLKQAQDELVARQGDLAQSIPYLTSDARQAAAADKMDLRTNIINARIDREQDAADTFASLMSEARTDAEQKQNRERTRKRANQGETDEGVRNAMIAARDALSRWKANEPDDKGVRPQDVTKLNTTQDWRSFAAFLVKQYEGFNLADAAKVLNQLRRYNTSTDAVRTGIAGVRRGIGG